MAEQEEGKVYHWAHVAPPELLQVALVLVDALAEVLAHPERTGFEVLEEIIEGLEALRDPSAGEPMGNLGSSPREEKSTDQV